MIGHPGEWLPLAAAVAHNIFSAGSGAVPGASYLAALGEIFWATSYEDALSAGQYVSSHGGDAELIEDFKDSFADSLGWSDEEFEQFWKDPSYEFTAEDAGRFDDTWDAWEFMLRR